MVDEESRRARRRDRELCTYKSCTGGPTGLAWSGVTVTAGSHPAIRSWFAGWAAAGTPKYFSSRGRTRSTRLINRHQSISSHSRHALPPPHLLFRHRNRRRQRQEDPTETSILLGHRPPFLLLFHLLRLSRGLDFLHRSTHLYSSSFSSLGNYYAHIVFGPNRPPMGISSKHVSGDGLHPSQGLFGDGEVEIAKPKPATSPPPPVQVRQQRQPRGGAAAPPLRCPRCESLNTKFCYFNNYSRSQPRYLCKSCRRHWTNGGTLRNVPVGGGRKNKRPKTSHSSSTSNGSTVADDERRREQQRDQQLPTAPFDPDHLRLCQTLLRPSASPSSTDYLTVGDARCSNGTSLLASLLYLPPLPPLPTTDTFYTSTSYPFLPFARNRVDDSTSEEQDNLNGLSSSSSMVDVGVGDIGGLFQSTTLLPTCGFPDENVLEPSGSAGDYWNCWDELGGFGTPPPPQVASSLPDSGRT